MRAAGECWVGVKGPPDVNEMLRGVDDVRTYNLTARKSLGIYVFMPPFAKPDIELFQNAYDQLRTPLRSALGFLCDQLLVWNTFGPATRMEYVLISR